MILVDEVGFIERYIFFNVILPVLEVEKTVLLCITSATDDTSWVARITSYRDPQGRPLLFSSNFTGACERCRKLEPVLMMKCTHRRDANPPFKSKSQRRKWGAIYELEGDTDVDMRENYGIITSSRAAAFDGAHIERFFDPARRFAASDACANRSRVPHVLCCVDPNGASLRNNTAVVIGYYDTVERKVVVGAASAWLYSSSYFFFENVPVRLRRPNGPVTMHRRPHRRRRCCRSPPRRDPPSSLPPPQSRDAPR